MFDTNILVYATVAESPWHDRARVTLKRLSTKNANLWISRQVILEYVAVMSRPQTFSAPLPRSLLAERIGYFETRFYLAEDGPEVMRRLAKLVASRDFGGRQVHDANIVATMQAHAVPCNLSVTCYI